MNGFAGDVGRPAIRTVGSRLACGLDSACNLGGAGSADQSACWCCCPTLLTVWGMQGSCLKWAVCMRGHRCRCNGCTAKSACGLDSACSAVCAGVWHACQVLKRQRKFRLQSKLQTNCFAGEADRLAVRTVGLALQLEHLAVRMRGADCAGE